MRKHKMRIIYNVITGLLSQGVTFVLAFLIPRLFLVSFGSEVKGMLSTITQIFAYLWLLEAGVGLATVQALYSPVSRDDRDSINAIMSAPISGCFRINQGFHSMSLGDSSIGGNE